MKFISPPDEAECDSNQMAKHCRVIFVIKKCASASDLLLFFLDSDGQKTKSEKPLLVDSESTL